MADSDALTYAQAFVALYDAIDGVSDEMSGRDFRLTQEYWSLYLEAKDFLGGGE